MAKDTFFNATKELHLQGRLYKLDQPRIMGILNCNPDSFFDGGQYTSEKKWLEQTEKMLGEGADFIDIGGISSRPGAQLVSEKEELERILPVVKSLSNAFPNIPLSIDTFRNEVALAALAEGASIINDISGGRWQPSILKTISEHQAAFIIMHSRHDFETMHQPTIYSDLTGEITRELESAIEKATASGITNLIADPGFGFSKNSDQNFELLGNLERLTRLPVPVLAGISRKSMIWKTLGSDPENALNGTTALHMICLQKGATILRVHDVKEAKETITLYTKISTYGKER